MKFYQNRTVDEQQARLPLEYQSNYYTTQIDRIEIDGEVIQGYFDYSFIEEKSYFTQPVRTQDGSIRDIDSYTTFLTPRLIIRYNMMNIDDYRRLMKLLKSSNSFNVEFYDIVEDKRVIHEMYAAPMQMPQIYQRYLQVLGIREASVELIGTNNPLSTLVHYHINKAGYPEDAYVQLKYARNATSANGEKGASVYIPSELNYDGETITGFTRFTTNPDGTGETYTTKSTYSIYNVENILNLYAQWR